MLAHPTPYELGHPEVGHLGERLSPSLINPGFDLSSEADTLLQHLYAHWPPYCVIPFIYKTKHPIDVKREPLKAKQKAGVVSVGTKR